MSIEKKISSKQLYALLCKNHPNINAKDDENLNLEDAAVIILKKCWEDTRTYYTVKEIQAATGMPERTIHNYAKYYNLKNRKTIKYDKQNVQSIKHF